LLLGGVRSFFSEAFFLPLEEPMAIWDKEVKKPASGKTVESAGQLSSDILLPSSGERGRKLRSPKS